MFFTNDVGDVTERDLQSLLDQQSEDERWEFKEEWPQQNLKTEKTVAALANTSGGYYLIGVRCDAAGKAIDLPGVSSDPQHNERVVSISGRIVPRIVPQVTELRLTNGKVVVVVYVSASPFMPHMCSDHKYYQRAGRQSSPMPEALVERLYIARHAGGQNIDNFLRDVDWGRRDPADDQYSISMYAMPSQAPRDFLVITRELVDYLRELTVRLPFGFAAGLRSGYHGLETRTHAFGMAEGGTWPFSELRHNGFLTSGVPETFVQPVHRERQSGINILRVINFVPQFLFAASRIYDKIGYRQFLRVGFCLRGRGETSLTIHNQTMNDQLPVTDPDFRFEMDTLLSAEGPFVFEASSLFLRRLLQSYGIDEFDLAEDRRKFLEETVKALRRLELPS
jgi:Putative DNA-binding domain